MSRDSFRLHQGTVPLLISFPHCGTALPDGLAERFTPVARALDDTDWLLPELYDFAEEIGSSTIVPRYSRYVIDLNRPPNDSSLYPGRRGTALVPVADFFERPIYAGAVPDAQECAARLETYWQPYHAALQAELQRLKAVHGKVLLWDAHSIRNVVPSLFDGVLPDLNIGSADGAAAAPAIVNAMAAVAGTSPFSTIVNGRFKGGYITRAYGAPETNIHAVQLEMSKSLYLTESVPPSLDAAKAPVLAKLLRAMIAAVLAALTN